MKAKSKTYEKYRSGMDAIYSENHPEHHKGYPWLESQIPIHSREEIKKELAIRGEFFRPEHLKLDASSRGEHLEQYRRECFILRDVHVDLAMQIKRTVFARHYGIDIFRKGHFNTECVKACPTPVGADGFNDEDHSIARNVAILGPSGSGKTTAMRIVSRLFPQVVIHREYGKTPFMVKQLNFLRVICPKASGAKAVWTNFYEALNLALGTNISTKGLTEAKLQERIAMDTRLHGISFLVIDEMQNLLLTGGYADETLAAFTRLNELAGLPLIYIGTPEIAEFLKAEMHSARRAAGSLPWKAMGLNDEWHWWVREVLKRGLVRTELKWTKELSEDFFDYSQGRVDLVVHLFTKAQQLVLDDGRESIRGTDIDKAKEYLHMTKELQDELREDRAKHEAELAAAQGKESESPEKPAKKPRNKKGVEETPNDPEPDI
jgi:AAA domain